MRKLVFAFAMTVMAMAMQSIPAAAIPLINGSISVTPFSVVKSSGTNTILGANGFTLGSAFTGAGIGDFSSFVFRPVAIANPYTFVPTTATPGFLVFNNGLGLTATFDLASSTVTSRNVTPGGGGTIDVFSLGLLHLTGFADTPATFNFAATKSGKSWSASGTLVAIGRTQQSVPEPITIAVFGAGLAGLGARRRKTGASV